MPTGEMSCGGEGEMSSPQSLLCSQVPSDSPPPRAGLISHIAGARECQRIWGSPVKRCFSPIPPLPVSFPITRPLLTERLLEAGFSDLRCSCPGMLRSNASGVSLPGTLGAALGGRFRCRQMKEVSVALLGLFPAPQCGILQEFWWSGGPRMSGAASGAWSACTCWPRDRSITRKCSQAPLQASRMRLPGAQPPVLDQASRDSEWFSFILTGRVAFSWLFYFVYLEIILKVTPARYT